MKHRTLFYDLETSPIISYNWGIWDQNAIEVIEDWQILSVAWMWDEEKKVHCVGQDDFKGYKPGVNNDKEVVKVIRDLFDEADIKVAHNGISFDDKKSHARMLVHDLAPPSPSASIDTKREAKKIGAFTSNRLGDLAKQLEVSLKGSPGGFETWKGCLAGDKKAWKKMKRYNKQDIPPLKELYLKLRPWMKTHPAINVYLGRPDACPKCGGTRMHKGTTYKATNSNTYQYYRCADCRGMAKSRVAEPREKAERMKYTN